MSRARAVAGGWGVERSEHTPDHDFCLIHVVPADEPGHRTDHGYACFCFPVPDVLDNRVAVHRRGIVQ